EDRLHLLAPLEAELVAAEPGLVEVDAGQLADLDAAELERLIDDAAREADADLRRRLEADRADQAPGARRALLLAALGVRAALGMVPALVLAAAGLAALGALAVLGQRERALDRRVDRAVDLGDVGDAAGQTDAALAEHAELRRQGALVLAAILGLALAG